MCLPAKGVLKNYAIILVRVEIFLTKNDYVGCVFSHLCLQNGGFLDSSPLCLLTHDHGLVSSSL
jgi:hypothetical protein